MSNITLLNGDCLVKLQELDDNSVDSIVTDPPYGIDFMGKKWDYDVPSTAIWEQCLRVLKPGGYLLAFAAGQVSRSKLLILVLPIHAAAECSTALRIQRPVALISVSLNVLARLFGYQVVQMDHNRIPI